VTILFDEKKARGEVLPDPLKRRVDHGPGRTHGFHNAEWWATRTLANLRKKTLGGGGKTSSPKLLKDDPYSSYNGRGKQLSFRSEDHLEKKKELWLKDRDQKGSSWRTNLMKGVIHNVSGESPPKREGVASLWAGKKTLARKERHRRGSIELTSFED